MQSVEESDDFETGFRATGQTLHFIKNQNRRGNQTKQVKQGDELLMHVCLKMLSTKYGFKKRAIPVAVIKRR